MDYRSWRGDSKIHRFEYQVGGVSELNNLTAHQTKFFIVIQHSVHVFNPDRINRSVKYQPFTIRRLKNTINNSNCDE